MDLLAHRRFPALDPDLFLEHVGGQPLALELVAMAVVGVQALDEAADRQLGVDRSEGGAEPNVVAELEAAAQVEAEEAAAGRYLDLFRNLLAQGLVQPVGVVGQYLVGQVLELSTADEDDLYRAMDWLLPRQQRIDGGRISLYGELGLAITPQRGAGGEGVGHNVLELADLVAAGLEAGQVIALE